MPTIDIDYQEFEQMLGMSFNKGVEKINDVLAFVKGEVKLFDEKEGIMNVEIKDTNRPDTWNIEGLVRALRGFLKIRTGLAEYTVGRLIGEVFVDARLDEIRPFIGCSLVRNVQLTDRIIRGFMHMQDKLDQSYGRNRQKTSIGLYNFDLIKLPLRYGVAKPTDVSFVPLGFSEKMTLKDMLTKHPKGLEYGHIVKPHSVYPILLDSEKKPLSFPPIINSNDLGRITEDTKNVFVEVTGSRHETVLDVLKIVTLSLIDRGGKAYATKIHYPHRKIEVLTPDFSTRTKSLDIAYANKILGFSLTSRQIGRLLSQAGYGVEKTDRERVQVRIPCYRVDVMHPVDIVEDVAIAYDYNKIEPVWRKMHVTGWERPENQLIDTLRETMVGLGFQEVLSYTLTSPENLFSKMGLKTQETVQISNPKVMTLTCLRNWLLPNLLEFISNNLHVECPQRIFELGKATLPDEKKETRTKDEEKLAAVSYHANAGFSEAKSTLEAFLMNLGVEWQIQETKHGSFVDGRAAQVTIDNVVAGIVGEIHPKVLETWGLENPAAGFEIDVKEIIRTKAVQASK